MSRHPAFEKDMRRLGHPEQIKQVNYSLSTQQVSPLNTVPSAGAIPPLQETDIRSDKRKRQRPETHQNLIHPDKEQTNHASNKGSANGTANPTPQGQIHYTDTETLLCDIAPPQHQILIQRSWWR